MIKSVKNSTSVFLRKIIIYFHIRRRDLGVSVWPWKVKINTGYRCNLKCPLCPTGLGESPEKPDLTTAAFRSILDKLRPVNEIYLFGWGEPLLNRDIIDMIRMAKGEDKYVAMDSCLNVANGERLKDLVTSGLDLLSVSLDGTDQETYAKYRIGGDFGLVIGNIKKIQAIKKELGRINPRIQWQYCVNKYNQANVGMAKKMAKDLGVDIKFIPIGLYLDCLNRIDLKAANEWLPFKTPSILKGQNSAETPINDSGYCYLLYYFPFIDVDGAVYFCCPSSAANSKNSLIDNSFLTSAGNLKDSSLMDILNNDIYRHARSLFTSNAIKLDRKMVCDVCRMYRKA